MTYSRLLAIQLALEGYAAELEPDDPALDLQLAHGGGDERVWLALAVRRLVRERAAVEFQERGTREMAAASPTGDEVTREAVAVAVVAAAA